MKSYLFFVLPAMVWLGVLFMNKSFVATELSAVTDEKAGTISIYRKAGKSPVIVQHALPGFRPYLHPITAPDGKGVLTEYSPGHHKHQTGLYWGFTRLNGRDYFHNPTADYWKRVSFTVLEEKGEQVKWQTVYDLLDEKGEAVMRETQNWSLKEEEGKFFLELEWNGEAKTDLTIGKYEYGGLFLRMPWREGINGEVINAARQKNEKAEGQRAMWVDVGMQVDGRKDLAHIAIFDHPENKGYPQSWRVDQQLGIGPVRARLGDWKIKKDETETIRHQLVIYTGVLNDLAITKNWETFSGQNSHFYTTTKLWELAQREGREAKFLTPEEAVKNMSIQDGYHVNTWAAEPMMTQPMAFCWDDKGRMWIAENLDYETRGTGFSNDGNSRIIILEDTDRDGVADKKKVFLEGIPFPAAIAVGFDGVFIGAPPNLLYVPDRNADDKADVEGIEVRLTGWGIRDRHETLNSFHWGPDGWLYGLQGFATPSKVRKPEGKGRLYKHKEAFPEDILEGPGVDINGGVWRYHPLKDRFEVVAHGFSNPWGIDYDAKGQLFISACVIPHLWHVIPGGIYQRQGGQHFNPYIYNDIKTIADHSHRSAHGGARVYLSDAFPASQKGRIFMANIHEHAVLSDVLTPKGSGFSAKHGDDFMLANNAQFVGFSMEIGPEGGLYVLDWHDADICGKEVLNKNTGRIFRITPKNSLAENWPGRYEDLNKLDDGQLVGLQKSKSEWHARRARLILQERAAKGILATNTHAQLQELFKGETETDLRLRAMWSLHVTNGFKEQALVGALSDKDEYIRAWAIQLLTEDNTLPREAVAKFTSMGRQDKSAVVRLYLASALQRIDKNAQWLLAAELVKHAEDSSDHNLPKMIWTGIEPLVKENPAKALQMISASGIPMVAQFVARRLVDAEQLPLLVKAVAKKSSMQVSMLQGMRDGIEGRYDIKAPANWKAVYSQLRLSDKATANIAMSLNQQFGNTEVAMNHLATIKDKKANINARRTALQALSLRQRQELIALLPSLLNEPALRSDVIRAIASFDHEPLGKMLIEKYNDFTPAEKLQVVQTMSSRPKYGWLLSQALSKNVVPKTDVPTYAARQLLRVVGSGFIEVWGPIEQAGIDQKAYLKYKKLLTDQAISKASPAKGKLIFKGTCGPCHKMYGEGGIIGPELTGSNRNNIEYLLSNVMDPSGEIQDDYKMVVITTRDGRNYAGNIASENERQLVMRVVGQDAVVINKSNIQSREATSVSMMPPGLFNTLNDQDVLSLVAYLRSMQDLGKPQAKR